MLKFSCLCVTYGRNEYIGEAVYSFLNQSYENKELIILNTCPRQEYVFEHPLVKVINLKERPESHCMAMHMSVLESSGDWLIPWDDDDIWLPEFISQYARHVEKDPNLGWIQAYGRYFSKIDQLVAYTPMGTYNHLFTVSRKLYDRVGGYINKSKTYDEDVCDLTLLNAILPHYGLNMVNESHDSSMIYRYAGVNYHHSSKKEVGKTNYEVCGEHVNRLLDNGTIPEGKIVIIPIEKYSWCDMAKKIFTLPPEYSNLKKTPKPENILPEIVCTSWQQYVHPFKLNDVYIGGKSPCIKTFDFAKTRDGHDIKSENGYIEFSGHKLTFDDYGQLVGTYRGSTRLRYSKIPYIKHISKSIIPASKINLYIQTYKSENKDRQKELDDCLKYNKSRTYLNVIEVPKQDRLTFKEMMEYIRLFSDIDTISIFANSDIVFDETIKHSLDMTPNECFWLTRYEDASIKPDGSLDRSRSWRNPTNGSSDVWVFRGVLREVNDIDFGFGIRACDVAFADRLSKAGYNVFNPCLQIRTYHIHKSNFRNYYDIPRVEKPWMNVDHCTLPYNFVLGYDFIYAHAFRDKCEYRFDNGDPKLIKNVNGLKNTIFVHSNRVETFFKHLAPSEPFILITNNADRSIDDNLIKYADNPLLIKWYAQNLRSSHPKVKAVPLGLINEESAYSERGYGDKRTIVDIITENNEKKHIINTMLTLRCGRDKVLEICGLDPQPLIPFKDYLRNLSESYFCLSPEGFGIDCYRTWEALYLKTIPIILKNGMYENGMYDGLPVIVLDKWEDFKTLKLNEHTYKKIWNNFDPKTITVDRFVPEFSSSIKPLYSKIVLDHPKRLMRMSKQWTREMDTKAWVSIGSIDDDNLDFYEPVSKMWKKFGYNTFLTVVCGENSIERTKHGIILRLKKTQIESLYWQSQISRFYASSYIDGVMIISNINIMPLRMEYFDSLIALIDDKNTVSISNEKSYFDDMLWTACNSKTFESILNSAVPFDAFCENYSSVSDKIRDHSITVKFMDNIPINGIERDNWIYRRRSLMNGEYTHATLLTPFKKYHTEISELISVRNKLESLQNPPERIMVSSKKLGCIVYLCDNGREWELKKSLDLLYKNFIPFNPYPVIVLHEEGFNKDDINFPVEFRRIQFDKTRTSSFENNTYRIGYCHMCDLFTYPIFDILKDEYTYYMRLDTDSFILSPFNRDIFTYMKYGNKKYAYISDGIDNPKFVVGFNDTIKEWMDINDIDSIENIENIPNGFYYYTNFEVCEIDWFVSSPYYSKMYEYIKSTNRIYDRRWGDAPIRGLGLRLFMPSDYITKITDLHYKHKSVFNSPK